MLKDKVIESYIKMDDYYTEFAKRIENRQQIEDSSIKRRNRSCKYLIQR